MSERFFTKEQRLCEVGGFALFSGRDEARERRVLIKAPLAAGPASRAGDALRREYALLKDLDLPGVPRALGVWDIAGAPALVLDALEGKLLRDLLRTRALDLKAALQIAAAIADTLDGLHLQGFVHRDVSPDTLLVSEDRQKAFLIDFSIAVRLSPERLREFNPNALEGTLAYMAPEQTGRLGPRLDHRADLYSLGITLYELLTGSPPFVSADPVALVHSHLARTPAPPRAARPEVPEVVSSLVMKLLAKAKEARYQSAAGLRADLAECLRRLDETGRIEPFPLGQHDASGVFSISRKLYGRKEELAALTQAALRVAGGKAELLLVKGYSGVGKSALVRAACERAAGQGAHFIEGKFDQLERVVPYAPFVQAFQQLVAELLAKPDEELAVYRDELAAALGANGRLIVDLIPALALILGPQPPVPPALGPSEAKERFKLTFQSFLEVFTRGARSLILFLDDLQWIDAASLGVLQALLTEPQGGHLLVIGAYRDNEVDESDPLALALGDLRNAGAALSAIELAPLGEAEVGELIADTLNRPAEAVLPLTEIVFGKTLGNPFFVGQFLTGLHERKLLIFEPGARAWRWDLTRIREADITDNVADFMSGALRRLPPATQEVLKLAACIGHRFDIATISRLRAQPERETLIALWDALEQGLVLPLADEPLPPRAPESARGPATGDGRRLPGGAGVYRFLHDRVQQAAYALIDDETRPALHLQIGRLLRRTGGDSALFDVANHCHLGAALITDPRERAELARLHLTAGQRAKAATAYKAALGHFTAGSELLPEAPDGEDHALRFELLKERAECEVLTGDLEGAESLFDALLPQAPSRMDRARIHHARMALYATQVRFADMVKSGLLGLRILGIELPDAPEECKAALPAELARIKAQLGGRRIEELAGLPELDDPESLLAMRLLLDLYVPSYLTNHALHLLTSARQINICLERGHSDVAACSFMNFGFISAGALRDLDSAHAYGKLALALHERFPNPQLTCRIYFNFGAFIPFYEPLRESVAHLERARRAGVDSCDLANLSYACFYTAKMKLAMGQELGGLLDEVGAFLGLMQRTKDMFSVAMLSIVRQVVLNLRGRTEGRATLSGEGFNEPGFTAMLEQGGFTYVACYLNLVKAEILFIHGFFAEALSAALAAEARVESAVGNYFPTEAPFFVCLAAGELHEDAEPHERARLQAMLDSRHAELASLAERCPHNFRHKERLVAAGLARMTGRAEEAASLLEEAIELAQAGGFLHHAAIAGEICARFHARRGRKRAARAYLAEAHADYHRWGAVAKASDLAEQHPELTSAVPGAGPRSWIATQQLSNRLLDIDSVLQAARALSSEIVLDKALDQVMRIMLASAGAQRAFLFLDREGALSLTASMTVDPDVVRVGQNIPLEQATELPVSMVRYVAHARGAAVVADAGKDPRFKDDPYIVRSGVQSALCLALEQQSRLTGILYLENAAVSGAFSADRVELLRLLSSQAAGAVENALLYASVQEARESLGRANEELTATNHRLEEELAERTRFEQLREQQEGTIRRQREMLLQLSTPLIPVTNEIMVMPLIGDMDAQRAQQALEAALSGVEARRAEVVILDVTGLKEVDSAVVDTLIRIKKALGLLGAQVVLTGMRAELAHTIVSMGIELGELVTKGNLQSGVAHAVALVHRKKKK